MGTQTLLWMCTLSCVLVYSDAATEFIAWYLFTYSYESTQYIGNDCAEGPGLSPRTQVQEGNKNTKPVGASFRCDYQYHAGVEGWLKYHQVPANWFEAQLRCHLEGGTLASPINKGFASALSSFGGRPIFTGIHATFSKGDFQTIEGKPLWKIEHVWACNEPDNVHLGEQCTVLYSDGHLADVPCDDAFPYVCYKKYDQNMVLNECGTFDNEYKLNPKTGSCYKFHHIQRNWTRAFMTCAAEGAYLAIINSEAEAQYFTTLYPPKGGTLELDVAHLGFHDYGERGVWRTIHGETLQNTTYYKFSDGQPDNAPPGEYCGSMFRNGRLNDVWCDRRFFFICEKDPKSLLCEDDLYQYTHYKLKP